MTNLDTNVIQVTNVSPTVTIEQMNTFFNFVGTVNEVVIYPKEDINSIQTQSKTCYVRFTDSNSVKIAQHLSNTVFIDRALIVTPVFDDRIPDESTSYSLTSGLNAGNNEGLINQVVTGNNGTQVISTMDPRLSALGLPQYPVLPSNTDPSKIEEIRRTIQITNLDSTVTGEDVLRFFNQIGEVKYVRLNTNDNIPSNLTKLQVALVEFTEQASVASALQSNSSLLGSLPIKVSHSTQPIIKPLASRNSNTQQKEIEEAMRRVRDSQMIEQPALIKLENILQLTNEHNKGINAAVAASLSDKRSSRSRSRSRRRSTSRTRRRSRSRESYRRRYEDRYRKSRSPPRRSPVRRSRTPRSDRDPKYDERRRHRSRSRESYRRRHEDRYDERRRVRERSRSSDRSHRHRDRSRERDYRRDRDKKRSKERSPTVKQHSSSRSSRELKVESDQSTRRHEKVVRDDEEDNNLMMDQDLIPSKGPATPPSIESFKFKKIRDDELRRSLSHSPPVKERKKERKHSKERKKKKDKRKVSSDEESDNSISNEMEH